MVNNCALCKQVIKRSAPGLQCAGDCRKYFHSSCGNVSKDILESVSAQSIDWFCTICKGKKRQSFVVQESLSPLVIGTPTTSGAESNSMMNFMMSIKADINEFKKQQAEFLSSMTFISESYDAINLKLERLDKQCDKIDVIANENITLKKIVYEQSVRITALEQAPLNNCIEINGIPDSIDVQPIEAFETISKALSIDFDKNEIDFCKRAKFAPKEKPKNIIVGFKNQAKKDSFLSEKRNKQLNTSIFGQHIGASGSNTTESKIFIHEMLCSANKKILYDTKSFAKNNGFKFVWVRDGVIYMRKSENHRFFIIRDSTDLNKIDMSNNHGNIK